MKNILLAAAIVATSLAACHKPQPVTIQKGIVLYNKYQDFPISIDIYNTKADYNHHTNAIYSRIIPGKGCLIVSDGTLAHNTKYYCDVYSDDLRYSNWTDNYWLQFTTPSPMLADTVIISCNYKPQRYIFLGPSSVLEARWVAVDRYSFSVSDWLWIPETSKYREVTIRHDMTGLIKSKDDQDNIITTDIKSIEPFTTPGSGVSGLFLADESGNGNKYKLINSPISPLNNHNNRTSPDTVIFEDQYAYWVMVRQ